MTRTLSASKGEPTRWFSASKADWAASSGGMGQCAEGTLNILVAAPAFDRQRILTGWPGKPVLGTLFQPAAYEGRWTGARSEVTPKYCERVTFADLEGL